MAWIAGVVAAGALAWAKLQALTFWQLARFMARPGIENGLAATVLIALMAWLLQVHAVLAHAG